MNKLENKIEQLEKYIEVKEQECNDLQERIDFLIDRNDKKQEVLDKIKEYCNNRLNYYQEMRRDYMREFDGYAEDDNENILELLEELK